jgi:hypothetical protein
MDIESQNIISKILKFSEISHSDDNLEEFSDFSDLFETLKVDNAMHSLLIKYLNTSLLEGILRKQKNNFSSAAAKQKIKYKSRVDTEQLDSILNLSLWKNAPTSNLFDLYEVKKNNFNLKTFSKSGNQLNTNSTNSSNVNNNKKLLTDNFDSEDNPADKKFRNNFKKNNKLEDEEENDISDKFHQTNNYMSFQVNLKIKK